MSRRSNWRKAARRARTRSHSTHSTFGRSLYRRLRLEPLEDRRLLAVVTVTTLADTVDFNDGMTSLREAIFATNTVPGADTINFAPALTAGGPATMLLTQGEFGITDELTINGPGASLLTIDASGNDPTPEVNKGDGSRVFSVDDGASNSLIDVTIAGLKLTGGDVPVDGGAIQSHENLFVFSTTIVGNSANISGGGIALTASNGAVVILNDCTIAENEATRGGGINAQVLSGGRFVISHSTLAGNQASIKRGAAFAEAGGIWILVYPDGSATISYCDIKDNRIIRTSPSRKSIGAGGVIRSYGTMLVDHTDIRNNFSDERVGGLVADGSALNPLIIRASTITGNEAVHAAGGLLLRNTRIEESIIADNHATYGGGLEVNRGVVITNSVISGNSALFDGGGIYTVTGPLSVIESLIEGNSAERRGGGIFHHDFTNFLSLQGSTIANNSADLGGGLWVWGGSIENSTVSNNDAIVGAGIYAAELTVSHSTVTLNYASGMGGGVFVDGSRLALDHTILAGNFGLYADLRARDNLTWPFFGFSGLDGVVPVAVEGVPFEMD